MADIIDLCCSDHSISDVDDDDDPLLSFQPFTAKASSSINSLTKKRKVEECEDLRKESVKQNRVVLNIDTESVSTRKDDSSSSSSIPATNKDMTITMSQNAKERLDDTVTERLSSSSTDGEIIEIDSSSEEECEDDEQSNSSHDEDMDNLEIIDNKRKMAIQNPYAKKFTFEAPAIVSPPLKAPSNKPSNMMHQRTPCKPIGNPYQKTSNVGRRQTSFSTSSLSRPITIAKRRVGKNVMYLLRDGNSGIEKWKLVKALNEEEKEACQRYRNKQKSIEKVMKTKPNL